MIKDFIMYQEGDRYNKLTLIALSHNDKHGRQIWTVKCDCGTVRLAEASRVKRGVLKSCGCLEVENRKKLNNSFKNKVDQWGKERSDNVTFETTVKASA